MTGAADNVLQVVMDGRVIGDIQRTGKRSMRLRYSTSGEGSTPLSVSMSDRSLRYREARVAPWIEGLLPDRPETLRQWRRRFAIASDVSAFALLRHVGEDVAGGAQFVRTERLDAVLGAPGDLNQLGQERVAEMLRRALADLPVSNPDPPHQDQKFSLAGVQAKIALHRASHSQHGTNRWSDPSGAVPTTHILKPAIPGMVDQDLTEVVTMRTARALGLPTARCWLEQYGDQRVIVVERYDRTVDARGRWRRVHQEDMCQALGVWPSRKYESQGGPGAAAIANLIHSRSHSREHDTRRFAQALVFNWLVCGTDAHARNYSLLLSASSVRLAPLYDLNTHLAFSDGSGNDLSMSVNGVYRATRITRSDWSAMAASLHVGPDWIADEIERQTEELLPAMTAAAQAEDIARHDSPAVERMISNTRRWLTRTRS